MREGWVLEADGLGYFTLKPPAEVREKMRFLTVTQLHGLESRKVIEVVARNPGAGPRAAQRTYGLTELGRTCRVPKVVGDP